VILIFLAHNKGCTKTGYVENEMMILLSKCYEQIKQKTGKSNKRVQSKSAVSLKQLAISSGKIKKIEIVEVYLMSRTTFAAEEIKELMNSMILL